MRDGVRETINTWVRISRFQRGRSGTFVLKYSEWVLLRNPLKSLSIYRNVSRRDCLNSVWMWNRWCCDDEQYADRKKDKNDASAPPMLLQRYLEFKLSNDVEQKEEQELSTRLIAQYVLNFRSQIVRMVWIRFASTRVKNFVRWWWTEMWSWWRSCWNRSRHVNWLKSRWDHCNLRGRLGRHKKQLVTNLKSCKMLNVHGERRINWGWEDKITRPCRASVCLVSSCRIVRFTSTYIAIDTRKINW